MFSIHYGPTLDPLCLIRYPYKIYPYRKQGLFINNTDNETPLYGKRGLFVGMYNKVRIIRPPLH